MLRLSLSHREVRHLGAFVEVLSSPLAYPDSSSWRRAVISRGKDLTAVDRAVFGLGLDAAGAVDEDGLDPAATAAYLEYYHQLDLGHDERRRRHRGSQVAGLRHELVNGWPVVPEFRVDFLSRFRLDAGAGMAYDVAPDVPCWCAFYPDTDEPAAFEKQVVPLLGLAFPAFRAGLDTLFRLHGLRAELDRLIENLSDGFLLVGREGTVLHRNPALRRMLTSERHGRRLARAVNHVVHRFSANAGSAELLPDFFRATPLITDMGAYDVIPTVPGDELKRLGVALIIQVVVRTHSSPSADVLRHRFGLSAREIEVTRCLEEGLSYKRTAERLGVSIDTVRSHIRRIYAKLEVHSVAGAVSRLHGE
jgi:DNA-binding CsgD family transcriptional regulator/PAS domain-containing protein